MSHAETSLLVLRYYLFEGEGEMSTEELETEALKLSPQNRARLAERLLESLETLTDEENERLWAEEAARRDAAWDPTTARSATDVFRDARSRLK